VGLDLRAGIPPSPFVFCDLPSLVDASCHPGSRGRIDRDWIVGVVKHEIDAMRIDEPKDALTSKERKRKRKGKKSMMMGQ
jgi:hypothetical protein